MKAFEIRGLLIQAFVLQKSLPKSFYRHFYLLIIINEMLSVAMVIAAPGGILALAWMVVLN
jgi:hypothetical protein